jgi:hypothetical protein
MFYKIGPGLKSFLSINVAGSTKIHYRCLWLNSWWIVTYQSNWSTGISKTKSKQQNPCSSCMHRPVMSWGNACTYCMHCSVMCMHWTVTSQTAACTYCTGSKVSSLSRIYLYSSYFEYVVFFKVSKGREKYIFLFKHRSFLFTNAVT